jgi:AraC family transcriptional regulator
MTGSPRPGAPRREEADDEETAGTYRRSSGRARDPRDPRLRDAVAEIGRVVDTAPRVERSQPHDGALVSERWVHGALHDHVEAMNAHVIMTYYGAAQSIEWRDGKRRQESRTRRDSVTVIPRGHAAHWDIHGPIAVSHIYLSEARLAAGVEAVAPGQRIELLDRVGFDDPVGSRILAILAQEATSAEPLPHLFVEETLDLLCLHLIRGHSSAGALTSPDARRGLTNRQVRRINELMTEHIADDLRLDQLAQAVGLSRFHFCRAFRTATGQTPHQWLTALRMLRARELLRDPKLPMTHVALAVGYETASAFAAVFRRTQGVSPSEFRRDGAR